MVVARSAVSRYPRRVQGTRAMRGRFKIAALLFTTELWFRPWVVIREGSAHAGVKRTTTRPDLGCGKALPVSEGTQDSAKAFAICLIAAEEGKGPNCFSRASLLLP